MYAIVLLQATLGFVAFLLLHSLWSSRTNNHGDRKKIQAPKAKGAWPIVGHLPLLSGPDPFRILGHLADKYGPVFRIQLGLQQALVVCSKEAVMQTTNDMHFMGRPNVLALKYMGFYGGFYALAPYGPFWQEMRKISIHELLSNTRVEILKPVRASEMTTCINELYSLCCNNGVIGSAKLNIGKWFQQVLFNMTSQVIARKRYSSIGKDAWDKELSCLKRAYEDFFVMLVTFQKSKGIPYTRWMNVQENRAMRKTEKEFDLILNSWIDEHKQHRGKRGQLKEDPDFLDIMISLYEESDGFVHGHKTDDVIKATISGILFAGTDANCATITWALALVLKHREVLQKVQQELDFHVGKERWVEESDIKNMTYLQAILKETFRLYPAGPLSILREALEDTTVEGHYVPKGTQLLVNIWKLHRDPRTWTDPYEFQPERFLTTHAGLEVKNQQFDLIPFSTGKRSCPGLATGTQMILLALARLLQGFNLVATNEPLNMTEAAGITMHKKYPLEVALTPRLPNKLYA
ncbi:cytochrome P450 CYP82D47-like [Apium graveolens]|uniref:cytochrome P450 CYP82D47-like n=1 Tax=Apium graveolens TaxID=4045 RepID=UPI003D7AB067